MLSCQKHHFSLPGDVHYLNCAYMSPLPRRVEAAGIRGMRAKRNPAGIVPADFFDTADSVRSLFAGLIGAEAGSIAIIAAASYGLGTAARNLPVGTGQRIVVVAEQFPSNVYTWRRLAGEAGAELCTIDPPDAALRRGEAWNERLLEAIDARTAVVAVPHVHWADGTRFDLEAIGQRVREAGAALVVDGTQSVGALPFDVARVQPDALICAAYKWLMGPYGIGLAYFGPRFADGTPLEENWIARKGSEHFGGLVRYTDQYQPGAVRYDVGERSNFILLPMVEAALTHLVEWQIPRIQAYCSTLVQDFIREARDLGCRVEEGAWRTDHLFGVRIRDDVPMERLMKALQAAGVSVSTRGNAVRIAPHVYNDAGDIAALTDAFSRVLRRTGAAA